MKLLKLAILFLLAGVVVASCQKEYSYENGLASGTLKQDSTGECMPALVNGTYKTDTSLTAANYIDVQVSIANPGAYIIKTDTVNGYSFSASGAIANQGLNTIRLLGNGKPIVAGLNEFAIKFDSSICYINVPVTGSSTPTVRPAVYTLVGSPNTCTGATQTNNYYQGIPTSNANTVSIKVNVDTAGSYTISTAAVNGVSFSATGTFTVGTNQTVILQATGTPTASGSFSYQFTTTAPNTVSNCGFSLTVQAAPTPATYTFNCTTPTFTGTYQAGQPANGTVTIQVTSTAGGSYDITSNTTTNNNGVTFSGVGVLQPSPNPQNVVLTASGTAAAAGTFTYTLTGTGVTATCNFDRMYTAVQTNVSDSINAQIAGVFTTFNLGATADTSSISGGGFTAYTLAVFGDSTSANGESIYFDITRPGSYAGVGTYTVNQGAAGVLVTADYTTASGNTYSAATDGSTQTNPFTIIIDVKTATRLKGRFSGNVKDASNAVKTITNGKFDVPL